MARAKYQVLVIPYKKNENDTLYCIFKRSDMDECWQFVAGGGEAEDKTPLVSAQREAFEEAGISSNMQKSNICKQEEELLDGFRELPEDDKEELLGLLRLKLRKVKKEKDMIAKSSGLTGTEKGNMVG